MIRLSPLFQVLSTSRAFLKFRMHSHLLTQGSLVEAILPSLFQFFSSCQAFNSCAVQTSCANNFQSTQSHHASHAITSFPSFHPRFLLPLDLHCMAVLQSVCHPAVTLCASTPACAFLLSGSRMGRSLSSPEMSLFLQRGYGFPDKPSPFPSSFPIFALNRTLPAIPATNFDDYLCVPPI